MGNQGLWQPTLLLLHVKYFFPVKSGRRRQEPVSIGAMFLNSRNSADGHQWQQHAGFAYLGLLSPFGVRACIISALKLADSRKNYISNSGSRKASSGNRDKRFLVNAARKKERVYSHRFL